MLLILPLQVGRPVDSPDGLTGTRFGTARVAPPMVSRHLAGVMRVWQRPSGVLSSRGSLTIGSLPRKTPAGGLTSGGTGGARGVRIVPGAISYRRVLVIMRPAVSRPTRLIGALSWHGVGPTLRTTNPPNCM